MKKLLVIIPAYNEEVTVADTVRSLLALDYRSYEIIVVDDGSPDGSWDIMQDYAARDSRIRLRRQKNGGLSAARNAGLELARRGLFIVGALALLVSAGALLLPEKAASVREKDGWTARFGRFGLFGVLFCAAAAILLVAGVLDGWMYSAFV